MKEVKESMKSVKDEEEKEMIPHWISLGFLHP
jgi:hypothetical protein